jgi:hypothetical protein
MSGDRRVASMAGQGRSRHMPDSAPQRGRIRPFDHDGRKTEPRDLDAADESTRNFRDVGQVLI